MTKLDNKVITYNIRAPQLTFLLLKSTNMNTALQVSDEISHWLVNSTEA